jgi:uridine kinase
MTPSNVTVIGICGPSASGKTVLARQLHKHLDLLSPFDVISLDAYTTNEKFYQLTSQESTYENKQTLSNEVMSAQFEMNFEHPILYDHEKMVSHIRSILQECAEKTDKVVLILEGFILYYFEEIYELTSVKIYLDVQDSDLLMKRRMTRSSDCGWGCNEEMWKLQIWPEHLKKRDLLLNRADVILDGTLPQDIVLETTIRYLKNNNLI